MPEETLTGLRPILDCVTRLSDTRYVAYFSYRNAATNPLVLPIGRDNRFYPEPADRGQPTVFPPGLSGRYPQSAFSVEWDGTTLLVWALDGKTATASTSSPSCATLQP